MYDTEVITVKLADILVYHSTWYRDVWITNVFISLTSFTLLRLNYYGNTHLLSVEIKINLQIKFRSLLITVYTIFILKQRTKIVHANQYNDILKQRAIFIAHYIID